MKKLTVLVFYAKAAEIDVEQIINDKVE